MNTWIKNNLWLLALLAVAFVFRFWNIASTEIQSDLAIYAVRALDWFDFLSTGSQSSPIVWYGYTPWWGNLSFHDHPPLVFALLWSSFKIFGETSLAAILPSAIAGFLIVVVTYVTASRFKSKKEALLATSIISVSALSVWVSRTGFLEGVESLFIALSIYFGLKYIKQTRFRDLLWWSLTVGLAVLSKYTAIFLIPAFVSYFLIFDRSFFKKAKNYLAAIPFLAVLTPVIIYNYHIFKDKGHFDAALSSMVGLKPEVFGILNREIESNPLNSLSALIQSFSVSMSWPLLIVMAVTLIYLIFLVFSKRSDPYDKFLTLNFGWLFLMFLFLSAAPRFIPIFIPILVLITASIFFKVYQNLQLSYQKVLVVVFIIFISFEAFYTINSHLTKVPVGQTPYTRAQNIFAYQGFVELDQFLVDNAYAKLTRRPHITALTEEVQSVNIAGREVIIFDERTSWSRGLWYVQRYQNYYDAPILSLTEIVASIGGEEQNIFEFLNANGASGYWVVISHNEARDENAGFEFRNLMDQVEGLIEASNIQPVKEIYHPNGNLLFSVYNFGIGNNQNQD